MNNDSVYRWLTSIKCTFSQLFDTFSSYDYSQSILTLVTSFIALNFIAYKFHFCVQYTELAVISGNHSYFLRIKCVGIWNVEGRKFSAACDIAFPKIRNLKCETRGFEVYFRAYICVDWSFGMISKISDAWKVHNEKFDIFFSVFFTDSSLKNIKSSNFIVSIIILHYDDWFFQQFYPF